MRLGESDNRQWIFGTTTSIVVFGEVSLSLIYIFPPLNQTQHFFSFLLKNSTAFFHKGIGQQHLFCFCNEGTFENVLRKGKMCAQQKERKSLPYDTCNIGLDICSICPLKVNEVI